jgi:protocatechuate 3,4-dioxygenase beta subunit
MANRFETRREFLRSAIGTAAVLPLIGSCKSATLAVGSGPDILAKIKQNAIQDPNGAWNGAISAPENVSWRTILSTERDRGEPLRISGTAFNADGTVAPNTLIYLYHTDFEGYYGRRSDEHRHGRYRGWMLTDTNGGYEFATIKPAPYPERRFAAHIHMTVTTVRQNEDWVDSILFEGDQLISAQERRMAGQKGGFNPILELVKGSDGVLAGRRDIKLMA